MELMEKKKIKTKKKKGEECIARSTFHTSKGRAVLATETDWGEGCF